MRALSVDMMDQRLKGLPPPLGSMEKESTGSRGVLDSKITSFFYGNREVHCTRGIKGFDRRHSKIKHSGG